VGETAALQRAALGTSRLLADTARRAELLARALDDAGQGATALRAEVTALRAALRPLSRALDGDTALARRNIPTPPALLDRVNHAVAAHYSSIAAPTATARRQIELAGAELERLLADLRPRVEAELPRLEAAAEAAGAPWTPGRIPVWPPAEKPR
jgi:hypothetical protein